MTIMTMHGLVLLVLLSQPVVGTITRNLALYAKTLQCGDIDEAVASRAVDGNNSPRHINNWNFRGATCSTTIYQVYPWWVVDLNALTAINLIFITNREEIEWYTQLGRIRIGSTHYPPDEITPTLTNIVVCASQEDHLNPGQRKPFLCNAYSRYVVIILEDMIVLTLCEVEVFKARNLAIGATTFQIDTYQSGEASRAVDGNDNSQWLEPAGLGSSCSHTTRRLNPWWAMDLKHSTSFNIIVITNREEQCCYERLSMLRIGTTMDNPNTNTPTVDNINVCANHDSHVERGKPKLFECNAVAQYIVIMLLQTEYLTLCEVEVYGGLEMTPCQSGPCQNNGKCTDTSNTYQCTCVGPFFGPDCKRAVNLALFSPAFQYSTTGLRYASMAVDGNMNSNTGIHAARSTACTHTNIHRNPWWAVDLKTVTNFNFIIITPRSDCCFDRMIKLRIGSTNNSPLISTPSNSNFDQCLDRDGVGRSFQDTKTFSCKARARYVIIILLDRNYLTLCEVQVFNAQNVAMYGQTYQISTKSGGGRKLYKSNLAVDGIRDYDWMTGFIHSCTHTELHTNPWWAVDLNPVNDFYNIIIITNTRGDQYQKLSNVRVGYCHYNPGSRPPTLRTINILFSQNAAFGSGESKLIFAKARARFLVVMLEKYSEMSICEVEVYAGMSTTPCNSGPCWNNGNCIDTGPNGKYKCTCPGGMTGQHCEIDIDECISTPCMNGGICNNGNNNYTCTCPKSHWGITCEKAGDGCSKKPCEKGDCQLKYALPLEYTCICNPGYSGRACEINNRRNCQGIRDGYIVDGQDPPISYREYVIDPDGAGPIPEMQVGCEFYKDSYGNIAVITYLHHQKENTRVTKSQPFSSINTIVYNNPMENIRAVIDDHEYCKQEMRFMCKEVDVMTNGRWLGYDGHYHHFVPAANEDGKCACSIIGGCANPGSNCNCDGIGTEDRLDYGRLTNKNIMPIVRLEMGGAGGLRTLNIKIGPIKCSKNEFDIPQNCTDIKDVVATEGIANSLKWKEVFLIDMDGQYGNSDGNIPPIHVVCNYEFWYTDVMMVPHNRFNGKVNQNNFTRFNDRHLIQYNLPEAYIREIINLHPFCTQDIGYKCKNSGLLNNYGGYWTSLDGTRRNYWGSSRESDGKCACGVTGMCQENSKACDCNIMDNTWRYDYGVLDNKNHLPVGSVTPSETIQQGSEAEYYLGWLGCAQRPFGVEPSCQWYRYRSTGWVNSYSYLIDPDGPLAAYPTPTQVLEDVKSFPVHCDFDKDTQLGVTVIPANILLSAQEDGVIPIAYWGEGVFNQNNPNDMQLVKSYLRKITSNSVYCTQEITWNCRRAPIHRGTVQHVLWRDMDGRQLLYFHGTSGNACRCNGQCHGDSQYKCNCDINTDDDLQDAGLLNNKTDLPVWNVVPSKGGHFDLGPLKCYDVFKTCHDFLEDAGLKLKLEKKNLQTNTGRYVIDPDGAGVVDPFPVYCKGYDTVISVGNSAKVGVDSRHVDSRSIYAGRFKKCHLIHYGVSIDKLRALTKGSPFCRQHGTFTCLNSQFSGFAHWKNREGEVMEGWAGNLNGNECQCGEINRCYGGEHVRCNCDNIDNLPHKDEGMLIDKTYLPISEICIGVEDTNHPTGWEHGFEVGSLTCSNYEFDFWKTCHSNRMQNTDINKDITEVVIIDTGDAGLVLPTLAICNMTYDPPVGITEFTPTDQSCRTETETTLVYLPAEIYQIQNIMSRSTYWRQDMIFSCAPGESTLMLSTIDGWYGNDGIKVTWDDSVIDKGDCPNGICICTLNKARVRVWETNTNVSQFHLPFTNVAKGSAARCVTVGPIQFFTVMQTCEDIYQAEMNEPSPLPGNRFAIDPDEGNGEELFGVTCLYIGDLVITKVNHYLVNPISITEDSTEYPIYYHEASVQQIEGLINRSHSCKQEVTYACRGVPQFNQFNDSYVQLKDRDGNLMKTFWGSDIHPNESDGCACASLGTCPTQHGQDVLCHCDTLTDWMERGPILSMELLPITGFVMGGLLNNLASATMQVGHLQCGSAYFGFDKVQSCNNLSYVPTGVYYVSESNDVAVAPVLKYCNFDPGTPLNDYNDCQSQPCFHGGFCQDGNDRFTCVCAAGFSGKQCQTNVDDCASEPCRNGATCDDRANLAVCECALGYFGDFCERSSDSCASIPCLNGGRCTNEPTEYTCTCPVNFAGVNCGENVGGCDDSPCRNGAICIEFTETFTCSCTSGYSDALCETDIDECESNPCQNYGQCFDMLGYFECVCIPGYNNTWCESEINECESNPCVINSTCIDKFNAFECACTPGYDGATCDQEINECESRPCEHGTYCKDDFNGYECDCVGLQFTGRTCNIPVPTTNFRGPPTTSPTSSNPEGFFSNSDAKKQFEAAALPTNRLNLIFILMGLSDFFIIMCAFIQFYIARKRYLKRQRLIDKRMNMQYLHEEEENDEELWPNVKRDISAETCKTIPESDLVQ